MSRKFVRSMIAWIVSCVMAVCCMSVPVFAVETDNLDEATKADYYTQYVAIAKDVAETTNREIRVLPMEEFTDEDWVSPEDYREIVTAIANWNIICKDPSEQLFSTSSASKEDTVTAGGKSFTIVISGTFTTQLRGERQYFSGAKSITSKLKSTSRGSWEQVGEEHEMIDSGRTMWVTVSGTLTVAGTEFDDILASAEFYCNSQGVIS